MITKTDIAKLTPEEKIFLVEEIWDSLAEDESNVPVTAAEKKLLDERWAEFKKNPKRALTLQEFKKRADKGR